MRTNRGLHNNKIINECNNLPSKARECSNKSIFKAEVQNNIIQNKEKLKQND